MQPATPGMPGWPPGRPAAAGYDPFARGPHAVGVCTLELPDASRGRILPCEVWYPARPQPAAQDGPAAGRGAAALAGQHPLVAYSHHAGGHRRKASFLASPLASHGNVVAAPDHSEVVAAALAPREAESDAERAERIDAIIASRVPDVRLVVDYLLSGAAGIELDPARVGLAGHSLGGWTVLAAPDTEPRAAAVVAMAPGGISRTRPGVLRRAWTSPGAGSFRPCTWPPSRTCRSRSTACRSCLTGPRRRSGCSCSAAPTTSTSWMTSKPITRRCGRWRCPRAARG